MTDKEEVKREGTKALEVRTFSNVKNLTIRIGSGTTGGEPLVQINTRSPAGFPYPAAHPLLAYGSLSLRLSKVLFLYDETSGIEQILLVDAEDLDGRLDGLLSDFKPDRVIGAPSFVARMCEYMHDTQTLSRIISIQLSNEYLTEAVEKILKMKMPNASLFMQYVSTETRTLSHGCLHLPRNQYHPADDAVIEILDTDDEGIGEIAVTKKMSPTLTLQRYRTGDAARFVQRACVCGRATTFELVGRAHFDFIRLNGVLLHQEEWERVMRDLSLYVADYRVEACEESSTGRIRGKVSVSIVPTSLFESMHEGSSFLSEEIAKRLFVTARKTLAYFIEEGTFLPLHISCVQSFPYQEKNTKLRLILK